RVRVRFAGTTFSRDGYITDVRNGRRYGDLDYYVLQPSMVVDLTDDSQNDTIIRYAVSKGASVQVPKDYNRRPVDQAIAASGGSFAACVGAGNIACIQAFINGGTPAAFNALRNQVLAKQNELGLYKIDGLSTSCAIPGDPIGLPGPAGSGGVTN